MNFIIKSIYFKFQKIKKILKNLSNKYIIYKYIILNKNILIHYVELKNLKIINYMYICIYTLYKLYIHF